MFYLVGSGSFRGDIPSPPYYYEDTRNATDTDGFSNIYRGHRDPMRATQYQTYEDAQTWLDEFDTDGGWIVYVYP